MAFAQIIEFTTTRPDEVAALVAQWHEDTDQVRNDRRRLVLSDRDNPGHYFNVIFFDSYEDAMHTSMLPATAVLADGVAAVSQGPVTFHNLDIVVDDV
jgi:hypothetical protein